MDTDRMAAMRAAQGPRKPALPQELTRKKAIRAFCLQCMGSEDGVQGNSLVKGCPSCCCPLWPYRLSGAPKQRLSIFKGQKIYGTQLTVGEY